MRKILVTATALVLLIATVLSVASCSILDAKDGVDIVLSASKAGKVEGNAEYSFESTSADISTLGLDIPTVDEPDTTPATPGLVFMMNDTRDAYRVIGYNTHYLEEGDALSKTIYIPYTYEGLPVVDIAPRAFWDVNIESITLPKTLLRICNMAFYGSTVSSINLPASLAVIEDNAFLECSALSSITVEQGNARYTIENSYLKDGATLVRGFGDGVISESITAIAPGAYNGCSALTSIVVPETVTSLGYGVFSGCRNLASAEIYSPVEKLENNTFDGCTSLISVTLPETVKTLGVAAFRNTGFTEFTVPASVTYLESYCFAECKNLTKFDFGFVVDKSYWMLDADGNYLLTDKGRKQLNREFKGETVKIESFVLENCTALQKVYFAEGVTDIASYACRGCSSLTYVYLPDTCLKLGTGAFWGCSLLASLFIPYELITMGSTIAYGTVAGDSFEFLCEIGYKNLQWQDSFKLNLVENGTATNTALIVEHNAKVIYSASRPADPDAVPAE